MIVLNAEELEKSGLVGDKTDDLSIKLKSSPKHKQKWKKGKSGKDVHISSNVICFRCRKPGHIKNQCPNLKILSTKEKGKAK